MFLFIAECSMVEFIAEYSNTMDDYAQRPSQHRGLVEISLDQCLGCIRSWWDSSLAPCLGFIHPWWDCSLAPCRGCIRAYLHAMSRWAVKATGPRIGCVSWVAPVTFRVLGRACDLEVVDGCRKAINSAVHSAHFSHPKGG